ncbi:MAG: cytochrome c family protein [Magnetovibrio sp.]|nr:cytochrome c family protein [Magnetovibrio sp.]
MFKFIAGVVGVITTGVVLVYVLGDFEIQPQTTTAQVDVTPKETIQPTQNTKSVATESMAGSDVETGKKLFRKKCKNCHTFDPGGKNMTGPNLWGIVGRDKAVAKNYRYSKTMKLKGGTWTEAELLSFIAGPRTFVPDTKMVFPGLKNETDRQNILAFLKSLAD